jgi:hypothetical protein
MKKENFDELMDIMESMSQDLKDFKIIENERLKLERKWHLLNKLPKVILSIRPLFIYYIKVGTEIQNNGKRIKEYRDRAYALSMRSEKLLKIVSNESS